VSTAQQIESILRPAGPIARVIAEMAWVLVIGGAIVFCIVMAALVRALTRRRQALEGGEPARAAWLWVAGGGFVFPVLVLSALLVYATLRTAGLTPAREPQELVITVTGRLWWWEVHYREPARGIDVVLANQINLPAGRAVTLGLVSDEVIHSFWVPALAGKVDMVPGRVHQLRVQADRPGVFRGQCAEFCGEQHARMALHVVAQAPEDFERWLALQAQPAEPPRDPTAQRGLQVFTELRCAACHTVRGLGASSSLGPDLTHVGSRLHLGAGTLTMGRGALMEWVRHPQRVKPGARMPSYERLDDDSMQALAAFLEQLR
jgi:cytochrome c oxidase subunit II